MTNKKYKTGIAPTVNNNSPINGSVTVIPDFLFESSVSPAVTEQMLPLNKLVPNPNNPYYVTRPDTNKDPWMSELIASIRENGILSPIVVRSLGNDKYEIISGHRRHYAANVIGLSEVPVVIKNVSDDEASILLVDYNLNRESLLPSEKGKAYKLKKEALLRKRETDPGSVTGNIDELIGGGDESGRNVRRYIRLLSLSSDLLLAVDNKTIPVKAGCELSYLNNTQQELVLNSLPCLNGNVSEDICKRIKRYFERHPSASEQEYEKYLAELINGSSETVNNEGSSYTTTTASKPVLKQFKLTQKEQQKYFPSTYTITDICDVIHQLLQDWAKKKITLDTKRRKKMFRNYLKQHEKTIHIGAWEYEGIKALAELHNISPDKYTSRYLNQTLFPNDIELYETVAREIDASYHATIESDLRHKLDVLFAFASVRHNIHSRDVDEFSEFLSLEEIPPCVDEINIAIADFKTALPIDNKTIDIGKTPVEIAAFVSAHWPVTYKLDETYSLLNALFKIPWPSNPVTLGNFIIWYGIVDGCEPIEVPEHLIGDTISRLRKAAGNAG